MTWRARWRPGSGVLRELVRLAQITFPKVAGGSFLIGLNLVLVRLLDPEDFGRFALAMAIILLGDAIFGSPFDFAVIRLSGQADRDAKAALLGERAAVRIKLALVGLATAGALAFAILAGKPNSGSASGPALILASGFATGALLLLRSTLVHLQIRANFKEFAAVETLHIVVKAGAVALYLFLFDAQVLPILILLGLGPLVAALFGDLRFDARLLSRAKLAHTGYRDVLTVSYWYVATIALGALIGRLDTLLLGWSGPAERVGLFSAGQVLASLPELLGSYIAVLLTPHLVPAMREGRLSALYHKVQPGLGLLAIVILILATIGGSFVGSFFFQGSYQNSATVALILLPATLAGMATIPFALPIVMFERKHFLLTVDSVIFPFALGAYFIAIPAYGEIGAAWVASVTSLLRSMAVQGAAFRLCFKAAKTPVA
jgi:O-antigen/teichoic acid export membrane protein